MFEPLREDLVNFDNENEYIKPKRCGIGNLGYPIRELRTYR